jgi:hypothetical protein
MRSEKELIQLLLDSDWLFKKNKSKALCTFSYRLFKSQNISLEEHNLILDIIEVNKPIKIFTSFYYFEPFKWQPRKEYLENLLKKYE